MKIERSIEKKYYASCDDLRQINEPMNPFQKRIFERKIKRSSILSQNYNPNHQHQNNMSIEQYGYEVKRIIDSAKLSIDLAHEKVNLAIQQVLQRHHNLDTYLKIKQIIDNFKSTMAYISSYVQNNSLIQTTDTNNQHHIPIKNYLPHQISASSEKYHSSYYPNHHHCQIEQSNHSNKMNKVRNINKIQNYQDQYNSKKSVYETILEQRRLKYHKNKKMI